jgi:hypothetical protein
VNQPQPAQLGTLARTPAVPIDGVADWYRRYKDLKAAADSIEKMLDEARSAILDSVQRQYGDQLPADLDFTVAGQPVMHRKLITRTSIDAKGLRAAHPALADQFTKTSTYPRVTFV